MQSLHDKQNLLEILGLKLGSDVLCCRSQHNGEHQRRQSVSLGEAMLDSTSCSRGGSTKLKLSLLVRPCVPQKGTPSCRKTTLLQHCQTNAWRNVIEGLGIVQRNQNGIRTVELVGKFLCCAENIMAVAAAVALRVEHLSHPGRRSEAK